MRIARQWGDHSAQLTDDLVQETYFKLCADNCRLLRNFESPHAGSIFGFLKVVTANVVHDHFRASRAAKRGAGEIPEDLDRYNRGIALPREPYLSDERAIEHGILLKQIDLFLTRFLAAEELARSRKIFWLYYRTGLSASAIAALPGIGLSTKGVESTLLRLSRLVRANLAGGPGTKVSSESPSEEKGLRPAGSF